MPRLPIDIYNPPPGYEVFTIQAGALYMDRYSMEIVEGYFVILAANLVLERSERLQDESMSYRLRTYMRGLTKVKAEMDYPTNFYGEGVFGFGPGDELDD